MRRHLLLLVTLLVFCLLAGCASDGYIKPKGRVVMGGSIENGF